MTQDKPEAEAAIDEADYEAIEAAVRATARGRAFLAEFARRSRSLDVESQLEQARQQVANLLGQLQRAYGPQQGSDPTEAAADESDARPEAVAAGDAEAPPEEAVADESEAQSELTAAADSEGPSEEAIEDESDAQPETAAADDSEVRPEAVADESEAPPEEVAADESEAPPETAAVDESEAPPETAAVDDSEAPPEEVAADDGEARSEKAAADDKKTRSKKTAANNKKARSKKAAADDKKARSKKAAADDGESPSEQPAAANAAEPGPENALIMETSQGQLVIELRPDLAPNHVARIKELTREGFYDGVDFHRVIDGFMAQTGDPSGTGTGGSGQKLKAEFSEESHVRGTCAMARAQDPDSADSQFFICFDEAPWLDGQYTVWGKVVEGMKNLDRIKRSKNGQRVSDPDRIVSLRVAADVEEPQSEPLRKSG